MLVGIFAISLSYWKAGYQLIILEVTLSESLHV